VAAGAETLQGLLDEWKLTESPPNDSDASQRLQQRVERILISRDVSSPCWKVLQSSLAQT